MSAPKKIAFALVGLLLAPVAALAEDTVNVSLTVVPNEDPKKDYPGDIVAKVMTTAAPPDLETIKLTQNDRKGQVTIGASGVKTYVQGNEKLGLAVVFETQHWWLGNDEWWMEGGTPESPNKAEEKVEGFYKPLKKAIDKFAAAGPKGSRYVLIPYGDSATTIGGADGDLAELGGDKLPKQGALSSTKGSDGRPTQVVGQNVAAGLDEAIERLKKMSVSRKVIVLISDGMQAEAAADREKIASSNGIEIYAIHLYNPDLGGEDGSALRKLTGKNVSRFKQAASSEDLEGKVNSVVADISDRYYVTFPGADVKLKKAFLWDEKARAFTVTVGDKKAEIEELALSPKWTAPWLRDTGGGFPWWLLLVIPLGLVALIAIGVKVFKKPAEAPVVQAPVVAAPPPPPPGPSAPQKTVMIGIGGDDQGFPVVGWIVPLNGPNQFQTFKLQGGSTKIGTSPPSHILINDGFMSTEHCQIVASPQGFTLVDGGSTNGTYVNERKVDKHELVDNDVITMGKTRFRFKSIN